MHARRFDSIEKRARQHVHRSLTDVEKRTEKFCAEPRNVQVVTLALLDERSTLNGSGFLSAAFAPSIAVAGALVTVVVSLSIADYNNLSAALLKLTDPVTGKVHGMSSGTYNAAIVSISRPLAWVAVAIVVLVALLVIGSRATDRRRATAVAWTRIFESHLLAPKAVKSSPRGWRVRFQRVTGIP